MKTLRKLKIQAIARELGVSGRTAAILLANGAYEVTSIASNPVVTQKIKIKTKK